MYDLGECGVLEEKALGLRQASMIFHLGRKKHEARSRHAKVPGMHLKNTCPKIGAPPI